MHFLRTIFWVLLAVVVALFTVRNWTPVTLSLWGDIQADTKVPLLLLVGFSIGWLPTWLLMWTRSEGISGASTPTNATWPRQSRPRHARATRSR